MPTHEGYTISILVDGEALPEYTPETRTDAQGRTVVTCWIPSEAGKEFQVSMRGPHHQTDKTDIAVLADGTFIYALVFPPSIRKDTHFKYTMSGKVTGSTLRPLLFSTLQTTDDDNYLQQRENYQDIGSVVCKLSRCRTKEKEGDNGPENEVLSVGGIIHETMKKAGKHTVKLGAERPSNHGPKDVSIASWTARDFLTVKFNYRSMDELRADGIAPPEPLKQGNSSLSSTITGRNPVPASDGRYAKPDVIDIDEDRDWQAEARIQSLKAQLRLERENLENRRASKKVKLESNLKREASPIQVPPSTSRIVIDLTVD
ncbi:hypothetical protein DL96DRAFT_317185 [Flagelloscypha sp. PMI_526]|nr:hypothetical protein DL96DRAFT_317185 [Flagelloscypha sp. PMI_526]